MSLRRMFSIQGAASHIWPSIAILLLSSFFSGAALHSAQRWHPDEAFYMTFARNAAVKGDWLLVAEPVDKPPLTFYTNALALALFAVDADENGVLYLDVHKGEFAGRLPSLWMSVLLVAVGMALARSIFRQRRIAWLVGILLALSPLRIAFAATAFTDLPMLLLATLSLWMAARNHWEWAGVWFIASVAAKPQSIFYLPLLLGVLLLKESLLLAHIPSHHGGKLSSPHALERRVRRVALKDILRFCRPLVLGMLILMVWDLAREAQGAVNVWAMGRANYTPTLLTRLPEIPTRFADLWATVQHLFGHAVLTVLLLAAGVFADGRIPRLLALWLTGFVSLHLAFTLNLYDRNLIVLLPPAALLVAAGLAKIGRERWMLPALMLLMLPFAWQSAAGQYELGGDRGLHDGIDELAAYLNSKPIAAVIYDRWLDWELDYYLGAWTNKRRVYYPTPEELVTGALALEEQGTRYFIAPITANYTPWLEALHAAGFDVQQDAAIGTFRVYTLQPP